LLNQTGAKQGQRKQQQLARDGAVGKIKGFSQNESPEFLLKLQPWAAA
jgi:hypothetical protein